MMLFDLLFLILLLAFPASLLAAGICAVTARRAKAIAILKVAAAAMAVYFSALLLVSFLTPQHFIRLGDDQCSDDWCIAVSAASRHASAEGNRYDVTLRLSSHAGRVAQRERFVVVYLQDSAGHRYDPAADRSEVSFDTLLEPGQTITAKRSLLVPPLANVIGLVVAREGGGNFPRCCIIGDDGSFFHKRTIVRLE